MKQALILIKRIVQIIDRHTLVFQKLKAIIVVDIILRVHTVNRYWIIILFQLPYDRCYMVYVVKVPCEKQVHNYQPYMAIEGAMASSKVAYPIYVVLFGILISGCSLWVTRL